MRSTAISTRMSNACSRPVSRCRRGVRALCRLGRDRGAVFATLPNGIGTAANMEASHPEDELRDTLPDNENHSGTRPAAWREGLTEGPGSVFADREHAEAETRYHTLTYEVTGRIARITFDRPERGERDHRGDARRARGRGGTGRSGPAGACDGGIGAGQGILRGLRSGDLRRERRQLEYEPRPVDGYRRGSARPGAQPQPLGHLGSDGRHAMMSRFNRGFASLLFANKPTVAKLHGFAVGGGTDIALYADQIICADDTKIGYPPTRVWGVPAAGMWAHRLGDQRAKRLLFTGDCLTGRQAEEWGLAVEAPPADQLDERTEELLERISRMPVNQLMMAKLALNSALLNQGVANSGMVSSVFDGISRHTREGFAFQLRAATVGFREAVRERDEPFGDWRRAQFDHESRPETAEN